MGTAITLHISGDDESEAMQELERLFENNFGEDQGKPS
jgi:phosphotransferase system HPr-like phosphotransfer protein